MKKSVLIVISACTFILVGCEKKEGNKISQEIESLDNKISSEINHLKDTLRSKHNTIIARDQFSTVTLNTNFVTLEGGEKTFKNIIDEHKGKTIVIDIWASWCPDCIKGFPSLEEVQKQYPDAAYVFLSLDKTEDAWRAAVEKYNLKGTHYYLNEKMNGKFGKSIDLDWIPRYIIINKEGKIADYKSIAADDKTFLFTLKKTEKKDN